MPHIQVLEKGVEEALSTAPSDAKVLFTKSSFWSLITFIVVVVSLSILTSQSIVVVLMGGVILWYAWCMGITLIVPALIKTKRPDTSSTINEELPLYIVMVALYKEADMVNQIIHTLGSLEYEKDKIEFVILLEEDDRETIKAFADVSLPDNWHILVLPDCNGLKTKPRALNVGWWYVDNTILANADGSKKDAMLVIFDAEDIPEPGQLYEAAELYLRNKEDFGTAQARLVITNDESGVIPILFSGAYELHFNIVLQILSRVDFVPLGGTSFHIPTEVVRKVGGWDSWNPTEDLYLAVLLAMSGLKTYMLDSVTYEEAPTELGNRLRQLTRWMKGFAITWLVFWKNPLENMQKLGVMKTSLFTSVVGGGATLPILNILTWVLTVVYFSTRSPVIEAMFTPLTYSMGMIVFVFGNLLSVYAMPTGVVKSNKASLVPWLFLFTPIHWLMISFATSRAYVQIFNGQAHLWEVTVHKPTQSHAKFATK